MSWLFEGTLLPSGEQVLLPITAASPGSADAPAVLLRGAFALQGLVDGHCHLTLDRDGGFPFVDLPGTPTRLARIARTGVSVVRDVGGERSATLRLAHGLLPGSPHVLAAGRFLAPAN